MSTTARRYWLKFLRGLGVKHFRARSGIGLPYICHVGDFSGEVPFYGRQHSAAEILLMAAWCRDIENPVILDVGANNGFIATQLAQLLRKNSPRIFAFEPVPSTFAQLALSIEQLGLRDSVMPICCAVSDSPGLCAIFYNPRESLFAQVRNDNLNPRAGSQSSLASMITIDEAVNALGGKPALIKIDVEGFEPRVLRGAAQLLAGDGRPALCFEWNPFAMLEVNASPLDLVDRLSNYRFYYIGDFEGQKKPFGEAIAELTLVDWVCNVFAVSRDKGDEWTDAKSHTISALAHH